MVRQFLSSDTDTRLNGMIGVDKISNPPVQTKPSFDWRIINLSFVCLVTPLFALFGKSLLRKTETKSKPMTKHIVYSRNTLP